MRTKLLSILALLLVAVTGAMAEPITIVWSSSDGGSFDDRVKYDKGPTFVDSSNEWRLYSGGTFTTDLGNFTEIKIEGGYIFTYGAATGWNDRTWTGKASSVYFYSRLTSDEGNNNFTITFTIEPTYSVTLADGIDDAANWTISPTAAEAGETVTLTYAGTKTVKSIKVVKKEEAAAAARPLAEATAEDLGKIVGGDGNIYDTKDAAVTAGTTAVAMIAYVGSDTDHATYKQGLAIALADESSSDWNTAKSTCEGKSAVANAAWLLPSESQWKAMFKAFGDDASIYLGLNTTITTAGGTALKEGYYWSSSELDEMGVISVELDNGEASVYVEDYKETYNRVRACLAFGEAAAPATPRTLAEVTAGDLGKIVGADGNIYDTKDAAETAGTTAVAMIAYVGSNTDHATHKQGLAIALANEGYFEWSPAKSTCEGKSAVANAAWMLPSRNQWEAMFKAFGNSKYNYTGLNTAITTAGGTALEEARTYWTSDEVDGTYALDMYPDYDGSVDWSNNPKSMALRVRACLAFGGEAAPVATVRPLTEATAEDLGKIAGADGNIYDTKDAAETAGTTALAMIAYVGSSTGHDTYTHGLAIALADESTSDWNTAKSTCEGKSAFTNAAWLLPSRNQWRAMFQAFGDNVLNCTGLNTAITNAGGTALQVENYWSSTEGGETYAWFVCLFANGNSDWDYDSKDVAHRVRACLAF